MKKTVLFLSIVFAFILASCQKEEPNPEGLFHLTAGTVAPAEIAMGTHSLEASFNGYARWLEVGVIGNYDYIEFSDQRLPNWIQVSADKKSFRMEFDENDGDTPREFTLYFSVCKGTKKEASFVTVNQGIITEEDMIKTEKEAVKNYLRKFDVIDHLPPLADIQPGSVSPFYQLDENGDVYMQVVKFGDGPAATDGQTVFFRFLRYDLLEYKKNGVLPKGNGNLGTTDAPYSLIVGTPSNYGYALQLPLRYALPLGSEVNLVITSAAGPVAEQPSHIPYLYNVIYEK